MRIPEARRLFLSELRDLAREARTSGSRVMVGWLGPRDAAGCCDLCEARERKLYTIAAMQAIVRGKFCQPRHREDGCRCTLLFYEGESLREREAAEAKLMREIEAIHAEEPSAWAPLPEPIPPMAPSDLPSVNMSGSLPMPRTGPLKGTVMRYPQCGLENPPSALTCDCGQNLTHAKGRVQRKTSWDATSISVLVVVLLFLGVLFSYLVAVRPGSPKPEPARLTSAMYNGIQTGMSYEDVVRVVGQPGQELSRNEIAGYTTVMYGWQNPDGSNMNVMFQNDRVIQKAQFGLK